jgi:putative hydrolase of the HAD superfamily
MILPANKVFVFDLDDTLYSESDFEKSGIKFVYDYLKIDTIDLDSVLNCRKNWIEQIVLKSNNFFTKHSILELYRHHKPQIELYNSAKVLLEKLITLKVEMSLITDGRSITQRNKLMALGIESYFKNIIISEEIKSEKPSELNYKMVMSNVSSKEYVYIADNTQKDFITPNKLGWTTICLLDKGQNVHKQNFELSKEYLPKFRINSFEEIILTNEY